VWLVSERKKKGVGVLKIVFGLAIVGIALIAVLVGIVVVSIDTIAKQGVERGAAFALQVPTTLDSADVGLMSGTFKMAGLEVKNPEGFQAPHFFKMNDAGVAVSLGTLGQDVIELPELTITGIDMYLVKEGGKANYEVIMNNLKRFEGEGKKEPDPSKPGPKFVIRKVDIKDVKVHATVLPLGGAANTVDVDIPEIVLTNIGSGGQSVSMAELVNIIMKAVFASAVNLGDVLPGDISEGLKGGLAQLGSLGDLGVGVAANIGGQVIGVAGDATKMLGDVGEGAGKAVEDAAKGLEEGVKGLFGGGDKKPDQ
jgi:hypothetical protein